MLKTTRSLLLLLGILVFQTCNKDESISPAEPETPIVTGPRLSVVNDNFESQPLVVAGSRPNNLFVAFKSELGGKQLTFTALEGELPNIMTDDEGNVWDFWGHAVDGPRQGAQLEPVNSGMGFWFIFGAMYPGVEIYQGPALGSIDFKRELNNEEWAIPTDKVFNATGLDGIPALEDSKFITYDAKLDIDGQFFLEDEDLIIGVEINGEVKAYPHPILDWHEIVNDEIGGVPIAVTYCPLTGTAKIWSRELPTGTTTFGVSGLLYNSNILPYDRQTTSIWTQLDNECVHGELIHEKTAFIHHVETTWGMWKRLYGNPVVLSNDTGIDRDYQEYPYGDYKSNHDFLSFPVDFDDTRLKRKERVFAVIINGKAKVYRSTDF